MAVREARLLERQVLFLRPARWYVNLKARVSEIWSKWSSARRRVPGNDDEDGSGEGLGADATQQPSTTPQKKRSRRHRDAWGVGDAPLTGF